MLSVPPIVQAWLKVLARPVPLEVAKPAALVCLEVQAPLEVRAAWAPVMVAWVAVLGARSKLSYTIYCLRALSAMRKNPALVLGGVIKCLRVGAGSLDGCFRQGCQIPTVKLTHASGSHSRI